MKTGFKNQTKDFNQTSRTWGSCGIERNAHEIWKAGVCSLEIVLN